MLSVEVCHGSSQTNCCTGGGSEAFGSSIFGAPDGTGFVYQTNRLGGNFQYVFTSLEARALILRKLTAYIMTDRCQMPV